MLFWRESKQERVEGVVLRGVEGVVRTSETYKPDIKDKIENWWASPLNMNILAVSDVTSPHFLYSTSACVNALAIYFHISWKAHPSMLFAKGMGEMENKQGGHFD